MSHGNLKSIVNLRVYCNNWHDGMGAYPSDVEKYAEEIEQEIAERYMELPVDADGVPIHTGDLMERCCEDDTERFTAWFFAANGDALDDETLFFKPSWCRHVKPRTVEDVLRDCCNEWNEHCGDDWESGVYAKYADEIRGMMA